MGLGSVGFRLGIATTLMVLTCACSGGPPPMPTLEVKPASYEVDFDRAWVAVNDVLAEDRMPIKVIERDSGVVATEFVISRQRYVVVIGERELDSSGRPLSRWVESTRYWLNVRVRREGPDRTVVDVIAHVEYMMFNDRGQPFKWMECLSSGDIESSFYAKLDQKLRQ